MNTVLQAIMLTVDSFKRVDAKPPVVIGINRDDYMRLRREEYNHLTFEIDELKQTPVTRCYGVIIMPISEDFKP